MPRNNNNHTSIVYCETFLSNKLFDLCQISKESLECSICLEGIDCKKCHVVLSCGHSYHIGCIINQPKCPICRK